MQFEVWCQRLTQVQRRPAAGTCRVLSRCLQCKTSGSDGAGIVRVAKSLDAFIRQQSTLLYPSGGLQQCSGKAQHLFLLPKGSAK